MGRITENKPELLTGFGNINFGKQYRQGNRVYDCRAIAMGLTAQPLGNMGGESYLYLVGEMSKEKKWRIRKLTERECFRLMGLTFEDCDKCKDVGVSKTQLYKQAGNGLVTNCIELIFEHLYKALYDNSFKCYDENFT